MTHTNSTTPSVAVDLSTRAPKARTHAPTAAVRAMSLAAVEALYQKTFEGLPRSAAAGETPVVAVPALAQATAPNLEALFDKFVSGTKPASVASDFVRPGFEQTFMPPMAADELPTLAETPKALRGSLAKLSDALFSVLEKKAGLAAAQTIASTNVGEWLLGPSRATLVQVAAQLSSALRQAIGKPNSSKLDPLVLDATHEAALGQLAISLPAGTLSSLGSIEEAITLLFMEIGKDAERDLQDMLKTMAARIQQKKAMREYAAQLREAHGAAKKLMQAEYTELSNRHLVDCTFEQFAAMRPVEVTMPTIDQAENGSWSVTMGSAQLGQPSWLASPNSIPVALAPKPDTSTNSGLAMTYGLSVESVAALKEFFLASGAAGKGESFADWMADHFSRAANADEAEENRKKGITLLGQGGAPGGSGPPPQRKTDVGTNANLNVPPSRRALVGGGAAPEPSPVGQGQQGGGASFKNEKASVQVTKEQAPLIAPKGGEQQGDKSQENAAKTEQARAAALAALGASQPPKGFARVASKTSGNLVGLDVFEKTQAKVKDDLDSLSDQTSLEQMQMQRYLERRAKCFETLSNTMKKSSTTAQAIIDNLK